MENRKSYSDMTACSREAAPVLFRQFRGAVLRLFTAITVTFAMQR
jgi:hypothetical protein